MKDWIFEENLRPWLEIVASIVGYAFEAEDWDAVHFGLANTDSEEGRWYRYPFGTTAVCAALARDPGTAVVACELDGVLPEQQKLVALAVSIAQQYQVEHRARPPSNPPLQRTGLAPRR